MIGDYAHRTEHWIHVSGSHDDSTLVHKAEMHWVRRSLLHVSNLEILEQ